MPNIQKTKSGKWKAIVEMGKDPVTGRRKRKTKTKPTKKEANAWIAEQVQKRDNGIVVDPKNYTLKEYLCRWLKDYAEPNLAATTYDGYEVIVKSHLIPALGQLKIDEIKPMHIQSYFTQKRSRGRKDGQSGGLSEKTLLQHFRVLSKALKQAVKWQLISNNPAKAVEAPKPKRSKDIKAMTKEQLNKLLAAAKEESEWIYNFTLVAAYTGMRRSELLGLPWDNVDFENETIRVKQALVTKVGEGSTIKETKSKSGTRPIKISEKLINALKNQKELQKKDKAKLGDKYDNELNLVFCKEDGSKYYPTTVNKKFNRATKKAGLNKFGIHDLRHTHATLLLKSEVNPKIVQERLGHASITVTLDTYSHVTLDMQEGAVQKLDDLME